MGMTDKQYESTMGLLLALLRMYEEEENPEQKKKIWDRIIRNLERVVENP